MCRYVRVKYTSSVEYDKHDNTCNCASLMKEGKRKNAQIKNIPYLSKKKTKATTPPQHPKM